MAACSLGDDTAPSTDGDSKADEAANDEGTRDNPYPAKITIAGGAWDDVGGYSAVLGRRQGGRTGRSEFTTGHTRLYRGTELIDETEGPGVATVDGLPDGPKEHRLPIKDGRVAVLNKVHADWRFTSAAGEESPTLLAVRYSPRGLNGHNHAGSGRPITLDCWSSAPPDPASSTIGASFDDALAWTELDVHRSRIMVRHRDGRLGCRRLRRRQPSGTDDAIRIA